MRSGQSTSVDAENDFILNSPILAKLKKGLENRMNLKTDSTHKEKRIGKQNEFKN